MRYPLRFSLLIPVLLGLSLGGSSHAIAQSVEWTFQAAIENVQPRPTIGETMVAVAEYFEGAPYQAGLLDESPEELLVETFDRFDCVLFVETALAMSQGLVSGDASRSGYRARLESLRYREGQRNGYCSRLHYFSEWIHDNAERGLVEDLTARLGHPWPKTRSFMSEHASAYPQLAQNDSLLQEIRSIEDELSTRPLHLIPRDSVQAILSLVRSGDILAFATPISGLDVTHTGIVRVGEDGQVGMIHASSPTGVRVSPDLQAYLQNNPSALGIFLARPRDPRN